MLHRCGGAILASIACFVASSAVQAQVRGRNGPTPCAGKPSADTTTYPPEALDDLPRIRKFTGIHPSVVPPIGTELRVHISFVVNKDGTVDTASVKLVDSTGTAFDGDARRWIRALVFWPGCYEGQAVRARVVQPVNYSQIRYPG